MFTTFVQDEKRGIKKIEFGKREIGLLKLVSLETGGEFSVVR